MFFRKKAKPESAPQTSPSKPADRGDKAAKPADKVSVRELARAAQPVRRQFPGPRGADALLRVAVERRAHADLVAHAKESLEAEVCGVLVGQFCEDGEGVFAHVEAAIRGAAARQGSTHVTFTQDTWNGIHKTLERDYPKLRIVGWYHTHPGFGVEFSDMDLFIQKNFFSGPAQIALVTDPLSGAVAIIVNADGGVEYLPRFWVDGREQAARTPGRPDASPATAGGSPAADAVGAPVTKDLEARVNQLVQTVDDLRAQLHNFLLFAGMAFCVGLISVVGYLIYSQFKARIEPPKNIGFMQVPVMIGDKPAVLGVNIVSWQLPPELDVMNAAVERAKRELVNLIMQAATNAAAVSNTPTPPKGTTNFPHESK
jgi:proteasome lid subunit RPN8/RPN11